MFYGGDFDLNDPNQNGLANENDAIVGGSPYGAATYQNFTLSGSATVDRPVHQQPERPEPGDWLLGNPLWRFGRQRRHADRFRHRR